MRRSLLILTIITTFVATLSAQNVTQTLANPQAGYYVVPAKVINGDTICVFKLPSVYCFPPMKFKNKRQEKFYWKTVRDVKKVLPYSKMIKELVQQVNDTLMRIPNKKERDKYMKQWEKTTYKKYYNEFTQMTLNQGKLLIRLVDRECQSTSYELIRAYRGSFAAGFYQMFAKLLGADLKASYGTKEEDKIIERVILLVEAGQL